MPNISIRIRKLPSHIFSIINFVMIFGYRRYYYYYYWHFLRSLMKSSASVQSTAKFIYLNEHEPIENVPKGAIQVYRKHYHKYILFSFSPGRNNFNYYYFVCTHMHTHTLARTFWGQFLHVGLKLIGPFKSIFACRNQVKRVH